MIWKNTDSFDTDRKMGNDLEKMGQLIRFVLLCAQKFLDETKKFRVAMLPHYPGICTSGIRQHYRLNITTNIETAVLSMRYQRDRTEKTEGGKPYHDKDQLLCLADRGQDTNIVRGTTQIGIRSSEMNIAPVNLRPSWFILVHDRPSSMSYVNGIGMDGWDGYHRSQVFYEYLRC